MAIFYAYFFHAEKHFSFFPSLYRCQNKIQVKLFLFPNMCKVHKMHLDKYVLYTHKTLLDPKVYGLVNKQ